ncbi:hypothetical protein ACG7TL_006872 [Trametes sanguinea]
MPRVLSISAFSEEAREGIPDSLLLAPDLPDMRIIQSSTHQIQPLPAITNGSSARPNVDASLRDEDIFVVEDSESSGDESEPSHGSAEGSAIPPSVHRSSAGDTNSGPHDHILKEVAAEHDDSHEPDPPQRARSADEDRTGSIAPGAFPKYFIRPDDTLLGISLKLGIDARILCRLNNLPISTLRTTPHLLHTRAFLVLPPSANPPRALSPAEQAFDEARRARLARERAETRFQSMTKETDRDVAKAYVALAGLPDGEGSGYKEYQEEKGLRKRRTRSGNDGDAEVSLEGRAMDCYYDDDDWEARERAEGRKPAFPSFPYALTASGSSQALQFSGEKSWWKWKN